MKRIDVGCGSHPCFDYAAYTDVYMHKNVANDPEVRRKFTKTAVESMPMFGDKEFDYSRCHHVMEHVDDPGKACAELVRISNQGDLWFPSVEIEILCGRDDHKWMVFQPKPNHLLFIRKRFKSYYGQGGKKQIPEEARAYVAQQQKVFHWEGSFTWTVVW